MSRGSRRTRLPVVVLALSATALAGCGLKPAARSTLSAAGGTVAQQDAGTAGTTSTDTGGAAAGGAGDGSGAGAGGPVAGTGTVTGGGGIATGGTAGTAGGGTSSGGGTATGTTTGGSGTGAGSTGTAPRPGTTTGTTGGTTGKTGSGTATGTRPGSPPAAGGAVAPGQQQAAGGAKVGPNSRVGINDAAKTIDVTIHAPVTGAAPVPSQAFNDASANLFWKTPDHKVFGYQVVAHIVDDEYKPEVARAKCESASRSSFVVVGGAGTDQIQACASDQVLASTNTPYLSAGVTTNGLTGIANYFAISLAYKDQSRAVVANARDRGADFSNCAIVTTQSPNFDDATASAQAAFGPVCKKVNVFRTPKNGSNTDAAQAGQKVAASGATLAYIVLAPTFWIAMLSGVPPTSSIYWVGPGVTFGENQVANIACKQTGNTLKASFLSPYPGLDRAPQGFTASGPSSDPGVADLQMSLYGASEVLYRAMLATGAIQNLTRENLLATLPRFAAQFGPDLSVYPSVNFNGGHFGGTGAWSLVADCGSGTYKTGRPTPYPA